jgi:diguanylate cyclase (GGDEF)-like protein
MSCEIANRFTDLAGKAGMRIPRRSVWLFVFAASLILSVDCAVCLADAKRTEPLPAVLTTAHAAHSLTIEEAARKHPVHLRAVVTYYDPFIDLRRPSFFVDDASGGIFVALSRLPAVPLKAGQVVEIDGVSDAGDYAPIVDAAEARVVGQSAVPATAPKVTLTDMLTGADDGQWVEIEGVVHAVRTTDKNVFLDLALSDGTITAITVKQAGTDYASLVDAKVRLRGNAAPLFNHLGQMTGAHILFPDLRTSVRIEEHAPNHPFALPLDHIGNLLRFTPNPAFHHRVRIRGTVTLLWPGRLICIQESPNSLCAQTGQTTAISPGELADVIGFPIIGEFTPTLAQARYQPAGSQPATVANAISADQAIQGNHDAQLVQLEGKFIAPDKAATDPTIVLSSGNSLYAAVLPAQSFKRLPPEWKEGTKFRIAGICQVQSATHEVSGQGFPIPSSFRILLRSPADLTVIERPPWWTPAHALVVLAFVLTGTLVVLGWVVALRRRLARRTTLLRESEERFRHMALHDALTGLATRLLLLDRLNVALESARRHQTGLAALMLDLDRFKEINDTYGHPAGDEVLRVTANRILLAVRREDTVARLGGDEFVVLLPDLTDSQVAERIAAAIVVALAAPIPYGPHRLQVSVSVGVCLVGSGQLDADQLLRNADTALYGAKQGGRNRFEFFERKIALTETQADFLSTDVPLEYR